MGGHTVGVGNSSGQLVNDVWESSNGEQHAYNIMCVCVCVCVCVRRHIHSYMPQNYHDRKIVDDFVFYRKGMAACDRECRVDAEIQNGCG